MPVSARRRRLAALALTAFMALGLAASAEESRYDLDYRFYLGGVLVGKASLAALIGLDGYSLDTSVRSDGVVGWFYDVTVTAAAAGARGPDDRLTPRWFQYRSAAEGVMHDLDMFYAGDAPDRLDAKPPFSPREYELDPRRQRGALDPMSAVAAALLPVDRASICDRTLAIFDGRRRYDILLEGVAAERTVGGAVEIDCKGRFRRVGGFKPKHMALPDVTFFARFGLEAGGAALLLRAWADTDFGAAVATLGRAPGRRR